LEIQLRKLVLFCGAILAVAALTLSLAGCAKSMGATSPGAASGITNLSVAKAYDLVKTNAGKADLTVIDVRTPAEYQGGHLAGALNIDVSSSDFESRVQQLNKGWQYLVYCRTGVRSAQASQSMASLGFMRIYNMLGGITDWTAAGYPITQ
jgi:rhodanese-related sulfurtransferase